MYCHYYCGGSCQESLSAQCAASALSLPPSTVLLGTGEVQMHRWWDWQKFRDWQLEWRRGPAGFPGISPEAELRRRGSPQGTPAHLPDRHYAETRCGLSAFCFIRHMLFTPKAVLSSSGLCGTREFACFTRRPARMLSRLFEEAFADPGPCLPESLLVLY